MKKLVIWANSYCRSTLGFYAGLGKAFSVPIQICVWKPISQERIKAGFNDSEFANLDIEFVGDNLDKAFKILNNNTEAHHIFGSYQSSKIYRNLIVSAKKHGCSVGIASEAPCNMIPGPSFRRFIHELYIRCLIKYKIFRVVKCADFIINFSGDDDTLLKLIGWDVSKIIPCGYYSPRITSSNIVLRTEYNWINFTILLSGIHQWHRSPILLLEALNLLKDENIVPKCIVTQDGPLLNEMKKYSVAHNLTNVEYLGFVSMPTLIRLYEICSVYIGCGNYEPWGMRLNDVLQCGSPLIVNEGMGGAKLVRDYGCGIIFVQNDARALASAIKSMIVDKNKYLEFSRNAYNAAFEISPEKKSHSISEIIKSKFIEWK